MKTLSRRRLYYYLLLKRSRTFSAKSTHSSYPVANMRYLEEKNMYAFCGIIETLTKIRGGNRWSGFCTSIASLLILAPKYFTLLKFLLRRSALLTFLVNFWHCFVLLSIASHCLALLHIASHCFTLLCIVLYCFALLALLSKSNVNKNAMNLYTALHCCCI